MDIAKEQMTTAKAPTQSSPLQEHRIDSFARQVTNAQPNSSLIELIETARSCNEQWQQLLKLDIIQRRLIPFSVPSSYGGIDLKDSAEILAGAINQNGTRFACLLADGIVKAALIDDTCVLSYGLDATVKIQVGKPQALAWRSINILVVLFENAYVELEFAIGSLDLRSKSLCSFSSKKIQGKILRKSGMQCLCTAEDSMLCRVTFKADGFSGDTLKAFYKDIKYMSLSPSGKIFMINDHKPDTLIYENNESLLDTYTLAGPPLTVVVSEDETSVGCIINNKIYIYAHPKGLLTDVIESHLTISCFAFSPCNRYIVYGTVEGHIVLYDIAQREFKLLYQHPSRVKCVEFSQNGDSVISHDKGLVLCMQWAKFFRSLKLEQIIFLLKCWQYSEASVNEMAALKKIGTEFPKDKQEFLAQYLECCSQCIMCNERRASCLLPCAHRACKPCLTRHLKERYECMVCRKRITEFLGPDKHFTVQYALKLS